MQEHGTFQNTTQSPSFDDVGARGSVRDGVRVTFHSLLSICLSEIRIKAVSSHHLEPSPPHDVEAGSCEGEKRIFLAQVSPSLQFSS